VKQRETVRADLAGLPDRNVATDQEGWHGGSEFPPQVVDRLDTRVSTRKVEIRDDQVGGRAAEPLSHLVRSVFFQIHVETRQIAFGVFLECILSCGERKTFRHKRESGFIHHDFGNLFERNGELEASNPRVGNDLNA
jgi:hypothetical protein